MRSFSLFFLIALTIPLSAEVLFEGYLRVTERGKHTGFYVTRMERDPKAKVIRYKSLSMFKSKKAGFDFDFETTSGVMLLDYKPVEFSTRHQYEGEMETVDGKFKDGRFTRNVKSGQKTKKGFRPVAPETMLNNFVSYLLVKNKDLKVGTEMKFPVIEEDSGDYKTRKVAVTGEETIRQVGTYKIDTSIEGDKDPADKMYISKEGEIVKVESGDVLIELVPTSQEAMGDLKPDEKKIKQYFGSIPQGRTNSVAKAAKK